MKQGCPKCGRFVEETNTKCPYCNYILKDEISLKEISNVEKNFDKNAGIVQRLIAFNLDIVLIMGLINIIDYIKVSLGYHSFNSFSLIMIITIVYLFYCSLLEASSLKGTVGAKILKIKIVDEGGYQIGFGMSFKRNFLKLLNLLTLFIGYFSIVFTKNKQSLSDYISETYVENDIIGYNSNLHYPNILIRLFAFIIDLIIVLLIYFILNYFVSSLNFQYGITKEIFYMFIFVIYFAFFDSKKATFGKKIFSLKVANLKGKNISIFNSMLRVIVLFFELLLIPFGILLCFSLPTRQTLKDFMTESVVIKNDNSE